MTDSLRIKKLTFEQSTLSKVADLLHSAMPNTSHINLDFLNWQYCDNPGRNAIGFNMYDGETLAGHYVTLPIKAKVTDNIEDGLLSINSVVHPKYRGKRIFKLLADETYKYAKEKGYTYVVGVANQNSTNLFKHQLNFQIVAPLDVKLGIGEIVKKPSQNNIDFERIWDKSQLTWRLNRPEGKYLLKECNEQIIIFSKTNRYGIWANVGDLKGTKDLSINKKERRLNPITLWIGFKQQINWNKSFYFDLPGVFRSSPLDLVFKDLTEKGRKLQKERVIFSIMDFDLF